MPAQAGIQLLWNLMDKKLASRRRGNVEEGSYECRHD
jgi:hypothetical protein